MSELIIGMINIVVTIISIIVTIVGIVKAVKKNEHQKSNRSDQD